MLRIRDFPGMAGLALHLVAGERGRDATVRWVHVSDIPDPTPWLEGGELLLSNGYGVGPDEASQRAYVRRLAGHGLAGVCFALGFAFAEPPPALVEEADELGFPVLTVPYEVPFVAISKAAFTSLASEELERVTHALAVHERLSQAVLDGRGLQTLVAILASHLRCSLAVVDESGRILAERHQGSRIPFDGALELPILAEEVRATLRAARAGRDFDEEDRLVLHHGQTAVAFELSRRRAVSATELRLAGDLLDDLEHERLDERDVARRMGAFGLDPERAYAALLVVPTGTGGSEDLRASVAAELSRRAVRFLSTSRPDRAAFLVEARQEEDVLGLAASLADREPGVRVGVGRPARGRALGRSLLEARAALDSSSARVATYRDLGSLELMLSLPDAALEAYVDRVLGPAAGNPWLVESLGALLETGCRWSEAAERLGVHRHTLRYRMERLREQAGRHPDDPEQRMELWLALRAAQALAARRGSG